MKDLNGKQLVGFSFATALIIFSFVAMLVNKEPEVWGAFLGGGVVVYLVTLFKSNFLDLFD